MGVDNSSIKKVVTYLRQLGLTDEQSDAYLFLLKEGPGTVLAISRGLKTGRTKLYPLLEELAGLQLIAVHERHYGTSYEAYPPAALEFLVSEQERKSDGLRKSLPMALAILERFQRLSPAVSKVVEYRGLDGAKQLQWNSSKADKEIRVFEENAIHAQASRHFREKLGGVWAEKGTVRQILTNEATRSFNKTNSYQRISLARYIDPALFRITYETYIYNNCIALLSYDGPEIYGVEIHNDKLARQQKQLFDLLWAQAKIIKD